MRLGLKNLFIYPFREGEDMATKRLMFFVLVLFAEAAPIEGVYRWSDRFNLHLNNILIQIFVVFCCLCVGVGEGAWRTKETRGEQVRKRKEMTISLKLDNTRTSTHARTYAHARRHSVLGFNANPVCSTCGLKFWSSVKKRVCSCIRLPWQSIAWRRLFPFKWCPFHDRDASLMHSLDIAPCWLRWKKHALGNTTWVSLQCSLSARHLHPSIVELQKSSINNGDLQLMASAVESLLSW